MTHHRPDPDALLAHINADSDADRGRGPRRGRLKVFLGATAGVGKTYAMLEEARARQREGVDVVIGVVETHGRGETQALLDGLEMLPRRTLDYRGVALTEFDLDAALARRPLLMLIDELAHSNTPGSRHSKRWQDVEELLAAGIDIFTTVNVQHLESLNDVVAQITHVTVRETVPDALLERADEVELVDIPPEELLKRLREGKIYLPQQAQRATEHFFRPGNLIALRQLALQRTAQRVDQQMRVYRSAHGVAETWPVAERIIVGVGPAPSSARLVRATKRIADRLGGEWIAVFVETPGSATWDKADRDRVWETLRLAESLGGETATVSGRDPAEEIIAYARARNVTRVVVGRPTHARWRDLIGGSTIDTIARQSQDIDLHVIATSDDAGIPQTRSGASAGTAGNGVGGRKPEGFATYLQTVAAISATTLVCVLLRPVFNVANLAMIFLLAVVVVAVWRGRRQSIVATVLSVLAFDFFCVPPFQTLAVSDGEYFVTFGVMMAVALVIGTLTTRLREQAAVARAREHRMLALYELSRDLAFTADSNELVRAGLEHLRREFSCDAVALLPDPFRQLHAASGSGEQSVTPQELAVASWVLENGRSAGRGTTTLPAGDWLFLPLDAGNVTVGVLGIRATNPDAVDEPDRRHLLEVFANQIAVGLERGQLGERARRVVQLEEMDRLKSEFVSTASHELRSPIASLLAETETLRERLGARTDAGEGELLDGVVRRAAQLRRLTDELLDLSRLETGVAQLSREPLEVTSLIECVMESFSTGARERSVTLDRDVANSLPSVFGDRRRLEGVLSSLISNALRATKAGGRILISADHVGNLVQFAVSDDGHGIPLEHQARVFDRFVQLPGSTPGDGAGLGLAIAAETVRAHGGTIWVDSGPGPGSVFSFTIPVANAVDQDPRE